MIKKTKVITGFMDGTDWDCELGANIEGNLVYPSIRSAETNRSECIEECGIVKVEVRFIKWVKKPKLEDYDDRHRR